MNLEGGKGLAVTVLSSCIPTSGVRANETKHKTTEFCYIAHGSMIVSSPPNKGLGCRSGLSVVAKRARYLYFSRIISKRRRRAHERTSAQAHRRATCRRIFACRTRLLRAQMYASKFSSPPNLRNSATRIGATVAKDDFSHERREPVDWMDWS